MANTLKRTSKITKRNRARITKKRKTNKRKVSNKRRSSKKSKKVRGGEVKGEVEDVSSPPASIVRQNTQKPLLSEKV